jgi:hypothetical protein
MKAGTQDIITSKSTRGVTLLMFFLKKNIKSEPNTFVLCGVPLHPEGMVLPTPSKSTKGRVKFSFSSFKIFEI